MATSTIGVVGRQANVRVLHVGLWLAQLALAGMFAMAGGMKAFASTAELSQKMAGMMTMPLELIRFIGWSELAGVVGLILPTATRIRPQLTAVAAGCLAVVMLLAAGLHLARGEYGAIATNVVLGAVAVFVAWGRSVGAPVQPRD